MMQWLMLLLLLLLLRLLQFANIPMRVVGSFVQISAVRYAGYTGNRGALVSVTWFLIIDNDV